MLALAGPAWKYDSDSADGENYFDEDERSVLLALRRDDYLE